MKARIITGLIGGAVALAAIILGGYYFAGFLLFIMAVSIFEYLRALKKSGKNPAIVPSVILFAAAAAGAFSDVVQPGNIFIRLPFNFYPLVLCVALMISAAVFVFDHRRRTFEDVALPFFGSLYITLLLWCGMALRFFPNDPKGLPGLHLIIMTLVGSIMSDTCAFAFGSLFGKKKLCPDISPKKTFAGMWGGFIGGAVGLVVYGIVLFFCHIDTGIPVWFCPVMGALVSFVSQVGDLFMSAIKRQCGIKDFGKMLPGHGGMLDRIDSYMPSFGVMYFAAVMFSLF